MPTIYVNDSPNPLILRTSEYTVRFEAGGYCAANPVLDAHVTVGRLTSYDQATYVAANPLAAEASVQRNFDRETAEEFEPQADLTGTAAWQSVALPVGTVAVIIAGTVAFNLALNSSASAPANNGIDLAANTEKRLACAGCTTLWYLGNGSTITWNVEKRVDG